MLETIHAPLFPMLGFYHLAFSHRQATAGKFPAPWRQRSWPDPPRQSRFAGRAPGRRPARGRCPGSWAGAGTPFSADQRRSWKPRRAGTRPWVGVLTSQGDLSTLVEVVQVLAEVLDCLCRDARAAQGLGRAGRCQDRVAQAGELRRKGRQLRLVVVVDRAGAPCRRASCAAPRRGRPCRALPDTGARRPALRRWTSSPGQGWYLRR